MSNRFSKINLYRDKSHKDYGQKQAGIFDWRQLTNIINKDSVLLGNDVEIGYNETGLPGNKTEFSYYLKGYVDFSWKVVMKNEQNNELKKAFDDFRKDLMVEIKDEIQQSETRVKSYVDEKVDNSEKNIKSYVDEKVETLRTEFKKDIKNETNSLRTEFKKEIIDSETRIKSFVKEQIDNHVQEYHK